MNEGKTCVYVPAAYIRLILGKRRRTIQRLERESGTTIQLENQNPQFGVFTIIGSPKNCEKAESLIKKILPTQMIEVPTDLIGLIIGQGGNTLRQLEGDSGTRIQLVPQNANVYVGRGLFTITGSPEDREKAEVLIKEILDKKSTSTPHRLDYEVEDKYIGLVIGQGGKNLRRIQTKSGAKIWSPSKGQSDNGFGSFSISGSQKDCDRAKALINEIITSAKDHASRNELGGDKHFVCLNGSDGTYRLKADCSGGPKLNNFLQGQRYRIEMDASGENMNREFDEETVSTVHDILLKSLEAIHKMKDEKELMVDLWCHFGKVFVHNVDEAESKEGLEAVGISRRVQRMVSYNKPNKVVAESNENEIKSHCEDYSVGWRPTFEEGIDPSSFNHKGLDGIPKHTQLRYDFAFTTPSARYLRFKVWEGLKGDEPPVEVKYLIRKVSMEGRDKVVAWLCYPSTSVVRGEIMTPHLKYDCRLKLRAGKRWCSPSEDGPEGEEENKKLCDYLSKCTFDYTGDRPDLHLPPGDLPQGFDCTFYRAAKEEIFTVDENDETFTVILLNEKGWDSDTSEKRPQEQLGIRVVLNSWSDALLKGEWEPKEIVDKLPEFFKFCSTSQDLLFKEQ